MASIPPGKNLHARAQLFMVRLWVEVLGHGRAEWRGKVQHIGSGRSRYFRDWRTLMRFLRSDLGRARREGSGGA
jgi:hypothetical protein